MVLDRHSACQTVCFCGVFPEINRAWASVDNSFFMWRFDRWCAGCPSNCHLCAPAPSMLLTECRVVISCMHWLHRNDVPLEYSGEEQAICAVGLVRPRPGVFVEAIQYVLVLCTTVEVRLAL